MRIKTFTKEEILAATNIRLDKSWDIFLTKFIETNRIIHTEICAYLASGYNQEVSCTCTPEVIPSVFAKILAYGEKYFQCSIWEAKEELPDLSNVNWNITPEMISEIAILDEDIENGLCTVTEMLKAYEVSGNTDYDFFKLKMPDGQIIEGREMQQLLYS